MTSKLSKVEQVVKDLVNLQLRKHGVDYDFIMENPRIEEQYWFSYYSMTEEESANFKAEAIQLIREELKCTKARAEKEYDWFHLMWGLRTEQLLDNQHNNLNNA